MSDLLLYFAIGFAAQLVDGAVGMAYGLVCTSVLLSLGIAPATASASVHAAEVVTTAASALSHWRLGNVDAALFRRLVIPGAVGGALGAYILSELPGDKVQPFVSMYLGVMGCVVLWKALRRPPPAQKPRPRHVAALGLTGGFLDAVGGGGWGPIVASTLIGTGTKARHVIGSTNAAEFVVTATISATFVFTIGLELWPIILGLIIGGVLAAPFAAQATRAMPERSLMVLVGIVILVLCVRGLIRSDWLPSPTMLVCSIGCTLEAWRLADQGWSAGFGRKISPTGKWQFFCSLCPKRSSRFRTSPVTASLLLNVGFRSSQAEWHERGG